MWAILPPLAFTSSFQRVRNSSRWFVISSRLSVWRHGRKCWRALSELCLAHEGLLMVTKDLIKVSPNDERKAREDGQAGKFHYQFMLRFLLSSFFISVHDSLRVPILQQLWASLFPVPTEPKVSPKVFDFSSGRPRPQHIRTIVCPAIHNALTHVDELTLTRRPSLRGGYMAAVA